MLQDSCLSFEGASVHDDDFLGVSLNLVAMYVCFGKAVRLSVPFAPRTILAKRSLALPSQRRQRPQRKTSHCCK